MVSDPIGDLITRLSNAGKVRHARVEVPYSRLKHAVADALVAAGYVQSAKMRGKKVKKTLDVELSYVDGAPKIRGVKRLSKPGRRLYTPATGIRTVKFGKGAVVLSTPAGIMTGADAKKANVGGEQLFEIW